MEVIDKQLLSAAILKCGSIGAELGYANNMRLLLIANPKTFHLTHKCRSDQDVIEKAPCWHLAAGLDLIAFLHGRTLNMGKTPLGTVIAVNDYVLGAEGIKDITPDFLASRGREPREGDFKLITLQEPQGPEPTQTSRKGFWARLFGPTQTGKCPSAPHRWT